MIYVCRTKIWRFQSSNLHHACKANLHSSLTVSLKAVRRYSIFKKGLELWFIIRAFIITMDLWRMLMAALG
jgi:hypothetical protein